jgi:hypothetical protein
MGSPRFPEKRASSPASPRQAVGTVISTAAPAEGRDVGPLLATVVPLSLGAMISPTMLAAIVLVLSMPVSPRARAWAAVGGCVVAMLALTVAAPLAAQALHAVKPVQMEWADVGLGVLLLGVALRAALHKHDATTRAKKRAPADGATAGPRLAEFALFGVVLIATDFSSTILYLAAMKEIGLAHISATEAIAVLAIPFVAVLVPAIVPTALSSIAPQQTDKGLKTVSAWTGAHSKAITVALCLVFSAYLLAKGLPPLLRG